MDVYISLLIAAIFIFMVGIIFLILFFEIKNKWNTAIKLLIQSYEADQCEDSKERLAHELQFKISRDAYIEGQGLAPQKEQESQEETNVLAEIS